MWLDAKTGVESKSNKKLKNQIGVFLKHHSHWLFVSQGEATDVSFGHISKEMVS